VWVAALRVNAAVGGAFVRILQRCLLAIKLERWAIKQWNKFADMFSRFDTMLRFHAQTDRRTNRQTPCNRNITRQKYTYG